MIHYPRSKIQDHTIRDLVFSSEEILDQTLSYLHVRQHPHAPVEVEGGRLLLRRREHVGPHDGLHRLRHLGVLREELRAVLGRQVPLVEPALVLEAGDLGGNSIELIFA